MPLPNLNEVQPEYEMVVPSTKQNVKFRPFLVKEQKNLLIALESKDMKQIINATLNNIETCVKDTKVKDLSVTDVDYMFTQIRAKSVGETIELNGPCTKCDAVTPVKVDFSKINVTDPPDNLIELAKDLKVQMRQPTYQMMLESDIIMDDKMPMVHKMFENVKNCMSIVYYGDEQIDLREETKEEIERFVESLTAEQLQLLVGYIEELPTLKQTVKFKCEKCEADNTLLLEGLQDFF